MVAAFVANPRVTLDLVTRDQTLGLQQQRALAVGQLAPAVRASGKITFSGQPTAADTLTFNGSAWTFRASGASGSESNIGGSLAVTLASLVTGLNASSDTQLVKFTYYLVGTAVVAVAKTGGTAGNALTLAKSCSVATLSAATLAGGAVAPGSATAATLVSDLPRTPAEINALFGAGSHLALMANAFRSVNQYTVMDALPLADAASSVLATAQILFAGAATQAGTFYVTVCDETDHTYEIDLNSGDTPATILTLLAAAIAADLAYPPFTYVHDGVATIQFMAKNTGTHANSWLLKVKGAVPGITTTLTGWANGATNPSLTGVFDLVANVRYQTVMWSEPYTLSTLANFLNARKNVDNDVLDGRGFVYRNVAIGTVMADSLGINSSEVVLLTNEPTSTATWIGPHIPACPDVLMARFAGARARRFEDGISIADIVATNEPNDQFGGDDKASLPYFNTPILYVGRPLNGTGYVDAEQLELRDHGVTVLGLNRTSTGVVMGEVVTTWQADAAGNPDDTWKYLEWRDTHGAIREYQVLNLRKRFSQYRMTPGDAVANYAMVNADMIRGYILGLCDDLMQLTLIVKGQASRQYIQDHLTVTLDLANRKASIAETVPMVSQLGAILGSIKFSFSIN